MMSKDLSKIDFKDLELFLIEGELNSPAWEGCNTVWELLTQEVDIFDGVKASVLDVVFECATRKARGE